MCAYELDSKINNSTRLSVVLIVFFPMILNAIIHTLTLQMKKA